MAAGCSANRTPGCSAPAARPTSRSCTATRCPTRQRCGGSGAPPGSPAGGPHVATRGVARAAVAGYAPRGTSEGMVSSGSGGRTRRVTEVPAVPSRAPSLRRIGAVGRPVYPLLEPALAVVPHLAVDDGVPEADRVPPRVALRADRRAPDHDVLEDRRVVQLHLDHRAAGVAEDPRLVEVQPTWVLDLHRLGE